jgi:diguanylate cyclase (GGDEF)-like protein
VRSDRLAADNRGVRQWQGVQLPEEREQQGRVNAGMSAMVAATLGLALAIPGVEENSTAVIVAIAVLSTVWTVAAIRWVDWKTAPAWVTHASAAAALVTATVGMAAGSGYDTPGRFYLVVVVVTTAYFFPVAEARLYPFAALAVHASPLVWEPAARNGQFLTELTIVAPVYVMLSVLIGGAKQHVVDLRGAAHRQARQDALTGLANRRALLEALDEEVGERASDRVALLLIDLDDFKRANTLHGHAGGDRALRRVAAVLLAELRREDLAARLGGDEFAVLIRGVERDVVQVVSERLLAALRAADATLDLPGFALRASLGWAIAPDDAPGGAALLAAADRAMLDAKSAGKDAVLAAN